MGKILSYLTFVLSCWIILALTLLCVGPSSCVSARQEEGGGEGQRSNPAASLVSALSPLVDGATVWAAASHPQYLIYTDLARRLLGQLESSGELEIQQDDLEQLSAILREYLAWTGKSHEEIEETMRYLGAAVVLVQAFQER